MKNTTVLVAGATGLSDNEICRQLREKNLQVKALRRTPKILKRVGKYL